MGIATYKKIGNATDARNFTRAVISSLSKGGIKAKEITALFLSLITILFNRQSKQKWINCSS
jgi:hypothetical protein